jgi:hypothetical protein
MIKYSWWFYYILSSSKNLIMRFVSFCNIAWDGTILNHSFTYKECHHCIALSTIMKAEKPHTHTHKWTYNFYPHHGFLEYVAIKNCITYRHHFTKSKDGWNIQIYSTDVSQLTLILWSLTSVCFIFTECYKLQLLSQYWKIKRTI